MFLTKDDRNFIVKPGDTLDGAYRVEEIGEQTLTLTFLPIGERQSLALGEVN